LNKLEQVKKYIDENNKKPSKHDKNNDIKILGLWLSTNKKNYKNDEKIMKNGEIKNLWKDFLEEYKEYLSKTEIWINKLEEVKKYINENNKRLSKHDKNQEIKILGKWLSHQQQNYKKNEKSMKNEEIKNLWKDFLEKYQEYFLSNEEIWKNKLEEVKNYINENNKRPSTHDKNNDIKILGHWISNQQQKYKNNKDVMKNEEIRNLWKDFLEEYQEYFYFKNFK